MPGIITHNRILKEALAGMARRKKKSYLLRSIETLLNDPARMRAALFGSLGPNIFDYLPLRDRQRQYCGEISFFLHNGGHEKLMAEFINTLYGYSDKNNEWAAMQRAYLYGFICHLVADMVIHPYVFYFSGFPDSFEKEKIQYFREQNLLFEYSIDNYFLHYDEQSSRYGFSIAEMLPLQSGRHLPRLEPAVRDLILESLKRAYPDIHRRMTILAKGPRGLAQESLTWLEFLPWLLRGTYRMKMQQGGRLMAILSDLKRRKLIFSDFIIPYPWHKKLNRDILNLHRERWQYPAGKAGFHYESILHLVQQACDRTVNAWEQVEGSLYGKADYGVLKELSENAYTGEPGAAYHDMKICHPRRV